MRWFFSLGHRLPGGSTDGSAAYFRRRVGAGPIRSAVHGAAASMFHQIRARRGG